MAGLGNSQRNLNQRSSRIRWDIVSIVVPIVFYCLLVIIPTGRVLLNPQASARRLLTAADLLEVDEFAEAERLWRELKNPSKSFSEEITVEQIQVMFMVLKGESESVLKRIRESRGQLQIARATIAHDIFMSVADFRSALECSKYMAQSPNLSTEEKLNLTSYLRALAGVELDVALRDINIITASSKAPELLDTKSWILHAIGRNEEALPIINEAIEAREREWNSDPKSQSQVGKFSKGRNRSIFDSDALAFDEDATYPNIEHLRDFERVRIHPMHSLAVMRFHRAEILEALGQDAATDRTWLIENGFTDESLLY